ncbi:hypothetical protein Tco_0347907 [Tanacetum coccineum]
MASFTIKSALFVLIITLLASFSNGFGSYFFYYLVIRNPWAGLAKGFLKGANKVLKRPPKSNANFKPPWTPPNSPKSMLNRGSEIPKEVISIQRGEYLARKFFGPGGKKGFRWGYKVYKGGDKVYKRYLVAEKRCQEYAKYLYPSCPRNQTNSNLLQCAAPHCIVELAANNGTCYGDYDSCALPADIKFVI